MRILSLNAGSLSVSSKARAFFPWALSQNADIVCLQSTARSQDNFPHYATLQGYKVFAHHSERGKGINGVAVYSRIGGHVVGRDGCAHDECQGRHVEVELPNGVVVCSTYIRSGGKAAVNPMWSQHLECIAQRMRALAGGKCVVAGDFNLALEAIDLFKPEPQYGFREEERSLYQGLITQNGWTDSFRYLNPGCQKYSRWHHNSIPVYPLGGWRIDYQFVSAALSGELQAATIHHAYSWDMRFSDHAVTITDYSI